MPEFRNDFVPPKEVDLKNKRRDYPPTSLSKIQLADPDKRIVEFKKNAIFKQTSEKISTVEVPEWFDEYRKTFNNEDFDVLKEIAKLSAYDLKELEKYIGGKFEELPYEIMDALLIDGTNSLEVAEILKIKRKEYLKIHPEMSRGVPGIDVGITTFNGRFINKDLWATASDSEKRSALVGTTCFHYNSGTPGMDDSPNDRF